jgi:hypothetical protein
MKKLVFMFVAVAAISFASCGQQAQPAQVDTDTIEEVVDSVIDSLTTDSVADTTAVAE